MTGYPLHHLGLAIDLNGTPCIGLYGSTATFVRVEQTSEAANEDINHNEHHIGPLRGASQRSAIVRALSGGSMPSPSERDLPREYAVALARMLREAGVA